MVQGINNVFLVLSHIIRDEQEVDPTFPDELYMGDEAEKNSRTTFKIFGLRNWTDSKI